MSVKYILVSMPDKFESKFNNMISNINRVNTESEGISIEGVYGERPEYVAVPKIEK